jgi:monofunctional chorismate mutase
MDLRKLRKNIDSFDDKIIFLISKRMNVVKKVATYKKKNNLPIYFKKREEEILERLKAKAKKLKVDEKLIVKIYKEMFSSSKKLQRR